MSPYSNRKTGFCTIFAFDKCFGKGMILISCNLSTMIVSTSNLVYLLIFNDFLSFLMFSLKFMNMQIRYLLRVTE